MKIKIINAEDTWGLEKKVNIFLESINANQIIDIKYQGIGNHSSCSIDRPSVMIIMK